MYELPITITIDDIEYPIRKRGDYRMVLDVFSVLEDNSITQSERLLCALIDFYEDLNDIEDINIFPNVEDAVKGMYKFFNADRQSGKGLDRKLIDWEQDSAMVASAINNVAGKEIRAEDYVHWWTFMGYYMAIGESTLSTVVSIRDKILRGKKMEKWERQFRTDNPQYFTWNNKTVEEQEAENWVMQMWNKG